VLIKGPIVTDGYFLEPQLTEESFVGEFLRTGDLGYFDEDGYLFLTDRKKDLIIRSGYKVFPREVEEVIYQHPLVEKVAVKGIADELHGEKVLAFIVLKINEPVNKDAFLKEIKKLCSDKLAKYKLPNLFKFVDDLPLTFSGKIQKRLLKLD
ncbi:MAG TPA: long-chain fatty acid--CoA ligase, partial [Vampirovibrionales bacterium]